MKEFKKFRLFDLAVFSYLTIISILILIFRKNLSGWYWYILVHFLYIGTVFSLIIAAEKTKNRFLYFIRLMYPIMSITFFYKEVDSFMHLIYPGWFDHIVTKLEYLVLGFHPTIVLEKIVCPVVTEFFKLSYFLYFVIIPFVPLYLYFTKARKELDEYIFTLLVTLFLCYIIFILFPVEGPRYTFSTLLKKANITGIVYMKELKGYIFTGLVDFIMRSGSCHGACIPSAHIAASFTILLMVRKYMRKYYPVILPITIAIFIATVYNRYHYISDVLSGIIVSYLSFKISPVFVGIYNRFTTRQQSHKGTK